MEQEIQLSVNMKTSYMYSFFFWHLHRSARGVIGVCISLIALVLFFMSLGGGGEWETRQVILLLIGLMFTIINPFLLWIRARKLVVLTPVYKEALTYTFRQDGFTIAQGDQEQFVEWGKVLKVCKTPTVLIIYTAKNAGSILAFREMGDKREAVETIIARGCKEAGITQIPSNMKK